MGVDVRGAAPADAEAQGASRSDRTEVTSVGIPYPAESVDGRVATGPRFPEYHDERQTEGAVPSPWFPRHSVDVATAKYHVEAFECRSDFAYRRPFPCFLDLDDSLAGLVARSKPRLSVCKRSRSGFPYEGSTTSGSSLFEGRAGIESECFKGPRHSQGYLDRGRHRETHKSMHRRDTRVMETIDQCGNSDYTNCHTAIFISDEFPGTEINEEHRAEPT
ncbi:hypothetical protein R1flu_002414 [Riccia fluitans]|uniref:Uncharacterized protein n=1 Tax=Riccia fluitans TaxID=41844 RepID=A0ABD1Y718_9MARC